MSSSAAERLNVFTLDNVKRVIVKNFCAGKKKGPKMLDIFHSTATKDQVGLWVVLLRHKNTFQLKELKYSSLLT